MSIKRIFIVISAIFAVSAVFADNSSVTSKKYVDDLMSGYQGKLPGSGANTLMIYDDETGIGEKSIAATLGNSASAVSVPTVGAVKTGLDEKQDTITGTAGYVMTGTGTPGEVGEKPIYSSTIRDEDSLVTAESVNSGVINAVNHSLRRVNANGELDNNGTLWEIADTVVGLSYLPAGYTQLEWIESDGSQYIITDLYGQSDNIHIDTKVYTPNMPSAEQDIIGNYTPETSSAKFVTGLSVKKIFVYDRNSNGAEPDGNLYSADMSGAQTLTISATYDSNTQQRTLTYNGTTKQNSYQRSAHNNTQKIVLLAYYNGTNAFVGKVYYIKYYEDGVIKLDLIPAKRNQDGVVGMYDTVSGTFLTNQRTGNFVAGPAVVGN